MRNSFTRFLTPTTLLIMAVLIAGVMLVSCSPYGSAVISYASARADTETATKGLIERFSREGALASIGGDVRNRYLSVKGSMITLDGAQVQVFEYADAQLARADAARFAPDALTVSIDGITQAIDWLATPHLYLRDTLLVLYVGDDVNTLQQLDNALGSRYAGGANPYSIAYAPIAE